LHGAYAQSIGPITSDIIRQTGDPSSPIPPLIILWMGNLVLEAEGSDSDSNGLRHEWEFGIWELLELVCYFMILVLVDLWDCIKREVRTLNPHSPFRVLPIAYWALETGDWRV